MRLEPTPPLLELHRRHIGLRLVGVSIPPSIWGTMWSAVMGLEGVVGVWHTGHMVVLAATCLRMAWLRLAMGLGWREQRLPLAMGRPHSEQVRMITA